MLSKQAGVSPDVRVTATPSKPPLHAAKKSKHASLAVHEKYFQGHTTAYNWRRAFRRKVAARAARNDGNVATATSAGKSPFIVGSAHYTPSAGAIKMIERTARRIAIAERRERHAQKRNEKKFIGSSADISDRPRNHRASRKTRPE